MRTGDRSEKEREKKRERERLREKERLTKEERSRLAQITCFVSQLGHVCVRAVSIPRDRAEQFPMSENAPSRTGSVCQDTLGSISPH